MVVAVLDVVELVALVEVDDNVVVVELNVAVVLDTVVVVLDAEVVLVDAEVVVDDTVVVDEQIPHITGQLSRVNWPTSILSKQCSTRTNAPHMAFSRTPRHSLGA